MDYVLPITGNEARLILYSIKNKKSMQADSLRMKLLALAAHENRAMLKAQTVAYRAYTPRKHHAENREENRQTADSI